MVWLKRRMQWLLVLCVMLQSMGFSLAQSIPANIMQQNNPVAPVDPAMMRGLAQAQASDYFNLQQKIYRWSDKTKFVLVYISEPRYMQDWQPVDTQVVKDAFAEWQHGLDNRLIFVFMNDPNQADVVVNWWDTTNAQVEHGACGLSMSQTWGKYISRNDIYFSLHSASGQTWNPNQLYPTALHEIGHMIGIKVHSDSPHDIMFWSTTQQLHLSERDINTVKRIYATKANFTNPPGYHLSHFDEFKKTQKSGFWLPILIPIPI